MVDQLTYQHLATLDLLVLLELKLELDSPNVSDGEHGKGFEERDSLNLFAHADRLPEHDPLLQPLGLTETEIDNLLAFLEAVSTRPRAVRIPD